MLLWSLTLKAWEECALASRPQVRAIGVGPTTHGGVTASVWIHSTSSPSQRLVRSTTVVHQHNERVQHTVDGHWQVREDDLQSFVIELEQGERDPLLLAEDWEKG